MKLIVCTEADDGVSFFGRRVSRDTEVCKDMLDSLKEGETIWMNAYSAKLFAFCTDERIRTEEDFRKKAPGNAVCFAEGGKVLEEFSCFDEITVYRWNRRYPSDVKFDAARCRQEFRLCSVTEFAGKSHEKITKEVYRK